ncbi:MAG: hypothetical protein AUI14_08025 [Actinobacteria bacterium 13_2_20CM_2_71_6]|nr:MAG: hypothetical protein AUI14_08025 [Actinobacteria bacterium 13_2_20CM_2_71_6]
MVLALGGCTPASVPASGVSASAAPGSTTPSPARTGELTRPTPALPSVTSAAFSESYAANCDGRPGVDRVIALLRSKGLIDGTAVVTVRLGPLCAGTWQYTVLSVTGREPLQVITQGPPTSLTLVTFGTDVCSVPVRTQAPIGIISVAHCTQ